MNYNYELWVEPKEKIEYIDKSITCIRRFDNEKRKGIIYEIDKKNNNPYLIVWKPTSDYDIENHGYVNEWCNEKELKKIK